MKPLELDYMIAHTPPPCYEEAVKKFGVNFYRGGVVFTYGNTIHVYKGELTPDLVQHESVHMLQQGNYDGGPAAWWKRYLSDEEFRLNQELEAYRHQWRYVRTFYKKNTHAHNLNFYARSLCMIYSIKGMTIEKAIELIDQK